MITYYSLDELIQQSDLHCRQKNYVNTSINIKLLMLQIHKKML